MTRERRTFMHILGISKTTDSLTNHVSQGVVRRRTEKVMLRLKLHCCSPSGGHQPHALQSKGGPAWLFHAVSAVRHTQRRTCGLSRYPPPCHFRLDQKSVGGHNSSHSSMLLSFSFHRSIPRSYLASRRSLSSDFLANCLVLRRRLSFADIQRKLMPPLCC